MKKIALHAPRLAAAILIAIFLSPVLSRAAGNTEVLLTGKTMGTYYRIKFIPDRQVSKALWEKKVDVRLKEVNARLSMYQKDSELSRFNRTPRGKAFRISSDFHQVLLQCKTLYGISHGAWDGTVKPLVDLWGFGVKKSVRTLPPVDKIAAALKKVGFDKLMLADRTLTKTAPGITLDLGSIAKGYGVDEIARLFREGGIKNCLVDIGGELAGFGVNKKEKPWVVGISKPEKKALSSGLYDAVRLENRAVATSGNYRNFFELNGKTYSHIIHPAKGWPVENQVVSASVIAETCTQADGLATALMVMDTPKAIAMIESLPDVECLIIKKQGQTLVPFRSTHFSDYEVRL